MLANLDHAAREELSRNSNPSLSPQPEIGALGGCTGVVFREAVVVAKGDASAHGDSDGRPQRDLTVSAARLPPWSPHLTFPVGMYVTQLLTVMMLG